MSQRQVIILCVAVSIAVVTTIIVAVNLATPQTRVIYRPIPTPLPPRPTAAQVQPTRPPNPVTSRPIEAFAAACGQYLRQVDIRQLLDLPAPNEDLFEYRHSMVWVITTMAQYYRGETPFDRLLTAYHRHTRAIDALPGEWHVMLVTAECYPETILGQRWEALKQAARAAR